MSNPDEPDKKPPPPVSREPADAPGSAPGPGTPAGSERPSDPGATQRLPMQPPAGPPKATTTPPAHPADPAASRTPPVDPAATQRLPADPAATQRLPTDPAATRTPPVDPAATKRLPSRPPATQEVPSQPPGPPAGAPDPGATVAFTAEDIARLEEESAAADEAAEEADRLIGTLIRDKWKVLKRLGAGSFGTVYKVEDVTGGWIEALKILGVDRLTGAEAEEMRARFLREAQIMKRLGKDSKHIVGLSTYEEDFEAGLVYFLMEFVEGTSLADALEEDGPFSADRAVRLGLQVCDALMVAHEGPEPVVHRDLKLENLMLTKDRAGEEMVKVLDFGIAKIAEREADSRLTTVGTLGTPGYAAPEQLRAEAVDGRTDLFAFGVILYALLTGRDPWLGNLAHEPTHQIYELMVATDRAQVRPIHESGRTIPPDVVNVVMKLLRRDPAQRFQSARELRDTLLQIQAGTAPAPGAVAGTTPGPTPTATGIVPDEGATVARPPGAAERRAAEREAPRPRPVPRRKKRGAARLVALVLVLAAGGATAWAQPWGRTLSTDGLVSQATAGTIPAIWFTESGVEGGLEVIPGVPEVLMPFTVDVPTSERTALLLQLRETGATVHAEWEIRRLLDLASDAQQRGRYYGAEGSDVLTYAQLLVSLEPGNAEAASLLRKVGERMAWDAEVARDEGPEGRAEELLERCLGLVPDHPRCAEVAGSGP